MRSPASPCLVVLALLTLTACKSKSPDDKLYGDLDPPTPNTLKGVYQTVVTDEGMSTEIRLDFEKDTLLGAVRCTPKNPALGEVSVDGQTDLQTDALDAATGQFTVAAFSMEKTVDTTFCQGGLRAATYDFKVEDLKLTLTTKEISEPLVYGKIGQVP
jgi:hypothetical protein